MIRVAAFGADFRSDFKEHRGFHWTGIDEETGDNHAVHIGGGECGCALGGLEGGEPEAEDDGVRMRDANRFGELIDAGSEEEIFARRELRVDCGSRVAGVRDEKAVEWDGAAGSTASRAR